MGISGTAGADPARGEAGRRPCGGAAETRGGHGLARRAHRGGVEALATPDLVALVLGAPLERSRRLARRLVEGTPLARLSRARAGELRALARHPVGEGGESGGPGDPGRGACIRLAAAFALGRRVERGAGPPRGPLRSAEQVYRLVAPELRGAEQECFQVLLLDGRHRLLRRTPVSAGTLTGSLVHPREVFRSAVREAAAALIAVHNHPSGDPEPSVEDLEVTRRLIEAGRILGVPLLDHVVVGGARWVSLRERLPFGEAAASRAANELRVSRRLERD